MKQQIDSVWSELQVQGAAMAAEEPLLGAFLRGAVLEQRCLEESLASLLSGTLASSAMDAPAIRSIFAEGFLSSPVVGEAICRDLAAHAERDPAAGNLIRPFLYYKGFHALEAFRVTHWLWNAPRTSLALYLQSRISEVFGVDIHPAARIGKGIFIDHATGLVIGETSVVGDDVSMLQEVTLGGSGNETGDRHPKVSNGVLIGAGAKILGNVRIGEGAKIGAGSVVLKDVPDHTTVAGVPAEIVGKPLIHLPSLNMDHSIEIDRISVRTGKQLDRPL
jgi:serine O-acetyltransferase